eukprot:TRINITY_DN11302_c0_g1_i1.p1 TRINITY_DN11302_c0_g1~~TRINITY_DN11302_c0_g1_i1.p1  ORF type:complete len:302 (+),score=77.47 TRINITY_DN11302_c0_g1_i1:144-1049(+)
MSFKSPITTLAFSPMSDFLSTGHVWSNVIYLWANVLYFSQAFIQPLSSSPVPATLPILQTINQDSSEEEEENSEDSSDEMEVDEEDGTDAYLSPAQLSSELITLSTQPQSRWHTLINLDLVQARNAPEKAVSKPEQAPFFLPTLPGLKPAFVRPEDESVSVSSRHIAMGNMQPETPLVVLLRDCASKDDFSPVMSHLNSLSPSGVDFEIRSLTVSDGTYSEYKLFLTFLLTQLRKCGDFELLQAFLSLFLRLHSSELSRADDEVLSLLDDISAVEDTLGGRLLGELDQTLCLLGFLSDTKV